ncbi:MAG: universal stress protein [Deltaproteobacteria bacterium]|nr:universal stress protein [Deltaproteobacteria bacterium]
MGFIHKILVATDFSEHADHAIAHAAEVSAKFAAPLLVLHVASSPVVPVPDGFVIVPPSALADLQIAVTEGLERAVARAHNAGAVEVTSAHAEGAAWEQIVETAREQGCDLIVVGTHGRSGLSRVLLGSTAERVVRKAGCAVLVVGPRAEK